MTHDLTLSADQILATFHTYGAPRDRWLVGGEFERVLTRPDGSPVFYHGPEGIRWILESLAAGDPSWVIKREGETPIALFRANGANITLEPGGQLELSGAPHATLAELADELGVHRSALQSVLEGSSVRPLSCGLTPLAKIEDIGWMPKGRYRIMQEYLPGDLAHYMMKATASVQCNYDFSDEADCARKVQLTAGLAPLTTALFANSPLYAGQDTGFASYRGHIWTRTDPDRTGFPPGLRDDYSHERWVEYLLDVPMMFYRSGESWLPARGRSFRSFLEQGIDGQRPGWDDWELHMTSVFPEVRIKRTIEVRGADCVPVPLALGFCALFSGLMYDDGALDQGLALVRELTACGDREGRFDAACREGLAAQIGGRSFAKWAEDLIAIAQGGLARREPAALSMLDPLEALAATGQSPSEKIRAAWQASPDPQALIRYLRY
jgi:glutamate--cysteine ligase